MLPPLLGRSVAQSQSTVVVAAGIAAKLQLYGRNGDHCAVIQHQGECHHDVQASIVMVCSMLRSGPSIKSSSSYWFQVMCQAAAVRARVCLQASRVAQ
jgi:hypothetical protein